MKSKKNVQKNTYFYFINFILFISFKNDMSYNNMQMYFTLLYIHNL